MLPPLNVTRTTVDQALEIKNTDIVNELSPDDRNAVFAALDDEKAAMRERAREAKAEARRGADRAEGERDLLAKIAAMPEPDRAMAKRLHAIIKASAPALSSKTWYGMPAYAKDGKVVCFFQSAEKFNARYATFGFTCLTAT